MFFKKSTVGAWGTVFFPMLISLAFSRLLTQTDFYFLRNFPKAVILISFFSQIAVFDSVLAFAVIPTCLITVSRYRSKNIRTGLVSLSLYCGIITALISALFSAALFFALKMNVKLETGFSEFVTVLTIVALTIPFRWMQLSSTSLLHLEKKGNIAVIVSFISIFFNYIADYWFLKLFGYIGCLLSTLLITAGTSISLTLYLKARIRKNGLGKIILHKSKNNIVKELSRIIFLKMGMSVVYGMILAGNISPVITFQFSVLFEFTNFVSVIPIAVYRTAVVFGKTSFKEKVLNIAASAAFIAIVYMLILLFLLEITSLYIAQNTAEHNGIFVFYLKTIGFLLFAESFTAFLRADMQIKNKFIGTTVIETAITYAFLIPFVYFSLYFAEYKATVAAFILNGLIIGLLYLTVLSLRKKDGNLQTVSR